MRARREFPSAPVHPEDNMTPTTPHETLTRPAHVAPYTNTEKAAKRNRRDAVRIRLRCCAELHVIEWTARGRVRLANHTRKDILAERTMMTMGAKPCACTEFMNAVKSIREARKFTDRARSRSKLTGHFASAGVSVSAKKAAAACIDDVATARHERMNGRAEVLRRLDDGLNVGFSDGSKEYWDRIRRERHGAAASGIVDAMEKVPEMSVVHLNANDCLAWRCTAPSSDWRSRTIMRTSVVVSAKPGWLLVRRAGLAHADYNGERTLVLSVRSRVSADEAEVVALVRVETPSACDDVGLKTTLHLPRVMRARRINDRWVLSAE